MEWILLVIGTFIFSFFTDKDSYRKNTTQKDLTRVPYDMYKPYRIYLQSNKWKVLRKTVIDRDKRRCTNCGTNCDLQVHHIHYNGIYDNFDFSLDQLQTLCKRCHDKLHNK